MIIPRQPGDNNPILPKSINTDGLMYNAMFAKVHPEITLEILTSIVRTNNIKIGIKLDLNHLVEHLTHKEHITFIH